MVVFTEEFIQQYINNPEVLKEKYPKLSTQDKEYLDNYVTQMKERKNT